MDTIFALASAAGRAGVAVVRISGADAEHVAAHLMSSVPEARGVRALRDGEDILDEALVLRFAGKASFTGEPVVELHLHGSTAIVSAVLAALDKTGARPAVAGEFTRRALENGRLDLSQVEGLADLIDAETEAQRKQALRVFQGDLGKLAEAWRADLIRAAALMEATIDFVDEDVPVDVTPEVADLLGRVSQALKIQIEGAGISERIRDGFEIAIVGAPNVGKSTLLNRLAGREAAITSAVAGTTRDVIEVRMDLGGLPVTILDTAGIRETDDLVEGLGISRARDRAKMADMRVFLIEPNGQPALEAAAGDIVVYAKADLLHGHTPSISGIDGTGINDLIQDIAGKLTKRAQGAGVAIRARHRACMQTAATDIENVLVNISKGCPPDLLAEDIRHAMRAIDMIVGRVDVEDLLDEIFASFCIGK